MVSLGLIPAGIPGQLGGNGTDTFVGNFTAQGQAGGQGRAIRRSFAPCQAAAHGGGRSGDSGLDDSKSGDSASDDPELGDSASDDPELGDPELGDSELGDSKSGDPELGKPASDELRSDRGESDGVGSASGIGQQPGAVGQKEQYCSGLRQQRIHKLRPVIYSVTVGVGSLNPDPSDRPKPVQLWEDQGSRGRCGETPPLGPIRWER